MPGGLYTQSIHARYVMTVLRIHLHRLSPVFIVPPAGVLGGNNFPSDNSTTGRDGIPCIDDRQMSNSQESSACRDVAPTISNPWRLLKAKAAAETEADAARIVEERRIQRFVWSSSTMIKYVE